MSQIGNKKKKTMGKVALAILLVLVIVVNIALIVFEGHANLYLGKGEVLVEQAEGTEAWDSEYYKMDYSDSEALEAAAAELVHNITDEGFTLLKNNGALPMVEA